MHSGPLPRLQENTSAAWTLPPAGVKSFVRASAAPEPTRWWDSFFSWARPADAPSSAEPPAPATGLKQLVYRSRSTDPKSVGALDSLLLEARVRNYAADITGLLIYHDGYYLQCLEGSASTVDTAFQAIRADARHDDVCVLQETAVDRRSFVGWNMACAWVNKSPWQAMSTTAWTNQILGLADASPGFVLMRNAWGKAEDACHDAQLALV